MSDHTSSLPDVSVVQVVPSLHPHSGGPSRMVVQLSDAVVRHMRVTLLSQSQLGAPSVASMASAVDRRVVEASSAWAMRTAVPLRMELNRMLFADRPSVIHSHGLWAPANHWAARAARRYRVPLVIHPRGMLEPWALAHKAWKKRVGMFLFQRGDLATARVLIATSEQEYDSIRRLGVRSPIAVIPNGVELRESFDVFPSADERSKCIRIALFLSRLHPVKGLINLLRAWAQLRPCGWRLRIAGPDEDGYLTELMTLVGRLDLAGSVEYVGEIDDLSKSEIYAAADLFVLPTLSENFGVVVAEALSHGLPVITTRGAPWAALETHRCGWWVDIGVEPLVEALRAATALSDEERRAMGARGREYVRRFEWSVIARDTIAVYNWIVGKGPRPACVVAT